MTVNKQTHSVPAVGLRPRPAALPARECSVAPGQPTVKKNADQAWMGLPSVV